LYNRDNQAKELDCQEKKEVGGYFQPRMNTNFSQMKHELFDITEGSELSFRRAKRGEIFALNDKISRFARNDSV
jgi:hypothetical protein